MTNNDIIIEFYDQIMRWSKEFCINEDCLQEIFLVLLEMDNSRLNKLYITNQIKGYICGLMHNMKYWKNSEYNKKLDRDTLYLEEICGGV